MEPPRYREAAAAEGGDGPGRSREPPGNGGGSATWNGSCGRQPGTGPEDEDDEDLPFLSPGGPGCRCRGEPAAPPSPAAERRDGSCGIACRNRAGPVPRGREEGEEDGAGWAGAAKGPRRPRRRPRRSAPREGEDGGGGRRHRPARKGSRGTGSQAAEEPPGYRGPGAERSGAGRAARWLRVGAGFGVRLLWTVCAFLLLLLVLLLGTLRFCCRLGAAAADRWVAALPEPLTALRRTWGFLRENRTCRYLRDWLQKGGIPPWTNRGGGTGETATPGTRRGGTGPGCGEEVTRLLAMAEVPEEELNPFQVLGAEATASDAELKKAYRRLAVLVHPDKNEHPRAEAAFKVLRAGWDMVSSPERRKEYEMKRTAESELRRSVGEFLSRLQDDLKEAMNTMMCSKCRGKHRRFEMERDPLSARYCAECGGLHPAEEGDFWAESSLLGLKITYFAMMDGKIYDITEWAGCQRVGISPDTHRVPYHISFGSRSAGRQRGTSKGSPASAADLQDFFARVFQGGSGMAPGSPFPAPPGAAAPPGESPRPEGAVPKGEAKHKRRKKVRRPFQR
ncbi:dnaJ homolog subfamily C member 14 [Rhynochetos jubatus]